MKIACLITAYNNFEHLERLVSALDDGNVRFFIHVDAKSRMPVHLFEKSEHVTLIPRRKVGWGGWSHCEAMLRLMQEAVRGDFDYCLILSGGDYPLRSNRIIYDTLGRGGEFINAAEGFSHDKPESRVKYYHLGCYDRRRNTPGKLFFRGIEVLLKLLFIHRRRYPFAKVYTGSIWSALSFGCVNHILDYTDKNPGFVNFFRTAWIPEESFFHTIIGNSPYRGQIKGTLTYADWSMAGSGPALITRKHLPLLAPGVLHERNLFAPYEPMFARKFTDESKEIVDEIDTKFRSEP